MNYHLTINFSHDEEQNGGAPPPSRDEITEALYGGKLVPTGVLIDIQAIDLDIY